MRKINLVAIMLVVALLMAACAATSVDKAAPEVSAAEQTAPETDVLEISDYLAAQAEVDAMLLAEAEAGYTLEAPLVVVNPYGNAPLSAVAVFRTESEVGGTVTVKGKTAEDDVSGSFAASREHFVPLFGLYAGDTTEVEIHLDTGERQTIYVEAEAVDTGLTNFNAEMTDPTRYDNSTLTICSYIESRFFAGYDSKGELRWLLTDTGSNAITELDNGHFLIPNQYGHGAEFPNGLTGIREIDPLGKVYHTYVWNGGEHHEIIVMPNGNYMVTGSRPDYATNRDYVFEIDPSSGEIVWELDMAEVVRPGSSGCESDQGMDWCHNNALAYDEQTDTLLISCRHLCAVVAVEKETKTLKWILGDPAGWAEEYSSNLLTPVGDDFSWSYGQHQLTILENGDLLLFDNGEFGRVKEINKQYALADEENYSRAVIYRIDEDERSVEQLWEYGRELGSECFACSMSGIQRLAQQRYLITFGTCADPDDYDGSVAHIQLIEDDSCVWKLDYKGANTYRGYRYSLYDGAYDPTVRGEWHGDIGVTEWDRGSGEILEAAAAPEGVKIDRYPFDALRFYGNFNVEDEDSLGAYTLILADREGNRYSFDLGYRTSELEDGIQVNLSRWVSLKELPEAYYEIFLEMNGQLYATGKSVKV